MTPLSQAIVTLLNARKKQVLLFAQSSMSKSQFEAFRRLFLNEFGKSGFEKELARVLADKQQKGR